MLFYELTNLSTQSRVEFADENFAREIMQLFSIGLHMLDNDGTKVLGANGEPILTYTNDEISEYARVWTGFRMHDRRGNLEAGTGKSDVTILLLSFCTIRKSNMTCFNAQVIILIRCISCSIFGMCFPKWV